MERETEVALTRELLAGNLHVLDRFIEGFRSRVFQYSLLMCNHHEDAEEVAQETLLKVFEKFNQLRDPENVRAWIFRIARNACYMKRRKSVFAPSQELSLEDFLPSPGGGDGGHTVQIADWSAVPENQLLQAEMKRVLRGAISELPEIYRAVIVLRDVEELSTAEAAEALEVSEDVVKTRLHRARLAVREKLDQYLRNSQRQEVVQPGTGGSK